MILTAVWESVSKLVRSRQRQQWAARIHADREVTVYDYADLDVPMLSRMFERRCQGYEAVGYTILLRSISNREKRGRFIGRAG